MSDTLFELFGQEQRVWVRRLGAYPAGSPREWEVVTAAPLDPVDGGWRVLVGPMRSEEEVGTVVGFPTQRPLGDDEVLDAIWVGDRLALAAAIGQAVGVRLSYAIIGWAGRSTLGFDGFAELRSVYQVLLEVTESVLGDSRPVARWLLIHPVDSGREASAIVEKIMGDSVEDLNAFDLDDINLRLDPWHLELLESPAGAAVPGFDVGLVLLDRVTTEELPISTSLQRALEIARSWTGEVTYGG